MYMGADGFVWVRWGAHLLARKKTRQKETQMSSHGMISEHDMAGKFPQKRYICAHRHKGVRRDSGGWGWVRMGAGGCISTQQTQNEANRGTDRSAGIILASVCGGKLLDKDDEVGT